MAGQPARRDIGSSGRGGVSTRPRGAFAQWDPPGWTGGDRRSKSHRRQRGRLEWSSCPRASVGTRPCSVWPYSSLSPPGWTLHLRSQPASDRVRAGPGPSRPQGPGEHGESLSRGTLQASTVQLGPGLSPSLRPQHPTPLAGGAARRGPHERTNPIGFCSREVPRGVKPAGTKKLCT